jgi:hypothetical protein
VSKSDNYYLGNSLIIKKNATGKVDLLVYIEQFINKSLLAFDYLKKHNRDDLYKTERDIDRERREKYAREQQKEKVVKLERLREKMYEKNKKVYVLPQRRSFGRYKPIEKASKIVLFEKVEEEDITDFLNYDEF